jgi:two-component system, LytTR family, response regulator
MQVLVIEDEKLAADRLADIISELEPEAKILQTLDSVRSAVRWLNNFEHPDLIFMDVQLADGVCFDIFEKVEVDVPVIFTTAYNEYALKAFKVNSIDYLLKPIDKDELSSALNKFKKLNHQPRSNMVIQPELLKQVMKMIQNPYKSRFAIRIGEHIKTIVIEDVSYFYSSEKSSFLRSVSGRDYAIDLSLELLEQDLDPQKFFIVSRKHIVALPHIKDIIAYSGSRLKLHLTGGENEEILVSREKVTDFKKWLDQ